MIPEERMDRPARYSDLFGGPRRQHGSDCAYCPICSAISIVRKTRPELLDHLAAAAREMLVVAGIVLEEAGDIIASVDGRKDGGDGPPDNVHHMGAG